MIEDSSHHIQNKLLSRKSRNLQLNYYNFEKFIVYEEMIESAQEWIYCFEIGDNVWHTITE